MEYNIFFYEAFKEEERLLKKYLPNEIRAGFTYNTIQESKSRELPSKIISIRTQSKIPEDWIKEIKAVISRTTGYGHLNYSKEILCGYLPDYCKRAVAEQAIMLCLALLRKLPKQMKQFSDFNRNDLTGLEAKGKKALVVGVGKIGYEIYNLAKKLEMIPFGVDIVKKYRDVNYISIEEGIRDCDIIICSMNLTKENYNYFNYNLLKKSKKGNIFINIARGELSLSEELLKLVNEKHLGGLALDVYNEEHLLGGSLRGEKIQEDKEIKAILDLMEKENVILTPHNSFNTFEALERKCSQTVEQLKSFLDRKEFIWKVPD